MPRLTTLDKCTGCAACRNACPHNAISMKPADRLGSLFPSVDSKVCVECKLCEKTCPVISPIAQRMPMHTFAAWCKDLNENKLSTSGGLATTFSKHVLKRGGIVYGCASQGMEVKHVRIDKIDDAEILRGSKYVQSSIGDVFRLVRKDLRESLQVLFIGTPCQVAGLLSYLRKPYDNLMTVDLICHGTPSLELLRGHVSEKVGKANVSRLAFREHGSFALDVYEGENLIYSSNLWKQRYKDAYYNTFIKGYTYRESCYTCRFSTPKRCSDITIGDYWGLGKEEPFHSEHANAGISVALINTNKGKVFFAEQADKFYKYERPLSEAVNGNPQLKAPKKKDISTKVFRFLFLKSHFSLKAALYTTDFYLLPVYFILNKIRK